ncbi:CHAT domain-containing protein, partial [Sulfurovum sp. bin170]|uniref:CHAT domain-containing protein n=1 Tax=Sulfurovum sp. bin170 TaxID=2695268 RepID=UPI0013E00CF6
QETRSKESLSDLYQLLLGNPLGDIMKKYKKLIISKDGAVHKIPFEALYNYDSKKYLIEEKEVLYVPSAQEFNRLKYTETAYTNSGKIVLFSNPNFQAEVDNRMDELRGSKILGLDDLPAFQGMKGFEKEANSIISIFPNSTINYERAEASEANLYKVKSPKILHFATHGFFIDDKNLSYSNLKSGIALSGYNSSRNDGESYEGIVTASKLLKLDLKGTELVVFSACDTGVGDIHDSEGVEGLNKVVVQVGAKRVMMSLWRVNDEQTAKFMGYYYQFLKEKKGYAEALRETKLKMIKEGLEPRYWSAFVLNGID